ncbi:MAG: pyridoxal-phosphate dependent enzyme [Patescibacteria group bacterium]|nr:pyridoxal-phosphate dependent enzyme [Patescibacteria group bacterium]MDE1966532.1 pyridoxal-phosphate dependent enzyme [Patescibacteria group bacterium]
MKQSRVFYGDNAIADFHDPKNNPIPFVELTSDPRFNPFRNAGVRIIAGLGYQLPLMNLKSVPVHGMIMAALRDGRLAGVNTIVESSSGNTAMALGVLGPLLAKAKVTALLPADCPPQKRELVRLLGVDEKLFATGNGPACAMELGKQDGCVNLAQYHCKDNPNSFYEWLGPQIWDAALERPSIVAVSMGTTGTAIGCSEYLRDRAAKVPRRPPLMLGVMCATGNAVPGSRTLERLSEIGLPWQKAIDDSVEIGSKESYRMSLRLIRKGFLAGPSSGLALAGLHRCLRRYLGDHTLHERLVDDRGEIIAVVVFPDTFFPYAEKYSVFLDREDFASELDT